MNVKQILYFFEILKVLGRESFSGMRVCVLGNQIIRKHAHQMEEFRHYSFKRLLLARGFGGAVSVDLNGDDGSLVCDISKPITEVGLVGQFDVVVNSGTTEHVMDDQWQVFCNMHSMLKDGGVFLHYLPMEGRGHGFWFYNESFFEWLARSCRYRVFDMRVTSNTYTYNRFKHSLFATLIKGTEHNFVAVEKWMNPIRDELGFTRFGAEYNAFVEKNLRQANG